MPRGSNGVDVVRQIAGQTGATVAATGSGSCILRVADRPLPTVALDAVPTIAGWPVRPVLAVEQKQDPRTCGTTAHVWDDGAVWDARCPAQ